MKITKEQLASILEAHKKWLVNNSEGSRANLSRANLSGADLSGADLGGANLSRANLSGADLSEANLSEANLSRANLSGADLSEANLSEANLSRANLSGADLSRANLSEANLSRANLSGADLSEANLSEANLSEANLSGADLGGANLQKLIDIRTIVPTGQFEAYKKTEEGVVLKLIIPATAKRLGGLIGRKCRASEAIVDSVCGDDKRVVFTSRHDPEFKYKIGERFSIEDFCEDPTVECTAGIHFFITEQEARDY